MKKLALSLYIIMLSLTACASTNENIADNQAYQNYLQWLDKLKIEMVEKGISAATIDRVYGQNDFYHAKPMAVVRDRQQTEFVLTTSAYLNRVVNATRVSQAQAKYREKRTLLSKIEKKYDLPGQYIVAFWGVETNFGQNFGGYNVIDALTEMSYDQRRSEFFKKELYNALKIIEDHDIDFQKMHSSWAGAMGHFQFMPSTYNAYAVDFDNDGVADIWENFGDAAASAANYLTTIGWDKDIPWGWEVKLPWNFNYNLSGRHNFRSLDEWKKLGLTGVNIKLSDIKGTIKAALITPEGAKGRAYLVTENFLKIMHWNRSENYALAIGLLSDYVINNKKWHKIERSALQNLKTDDVKKIQSFINRNGIAQLSEDGQLGSKTKEAIKLLQKRFLLNPDGHPDTNLLQKIDNFDPAKGFVIPVPERKLHKPK